MAMQLGTLRSALLEAGATPEKADKAAEEVVAYRIRRAGVPTRLTTMQIMIAGLYAVAMVVVYLLIRIALKAGVL